MTFSITKTVTGEDQEVEVHTPTFMPTYVTFHQDWSDYTIKPLYQVTNKELSGSAEHYEEIKAHLSRWMPELEFKEGE